MSKKTLVIGGGIAGITAAQKIAQNGGEVILIEKEDALGGNFAKLTYTFPVLGDAKSLVSQEVQKVQAAPSIEVLTNTTLTACQGSVGSFSVELKTMNETRQETVGAIIVAAGFHYMEPTAYTEYSYGRSPKVVTSLEFEKMAAENRLPQGNVRVVFVHCVGSRDKAKGYVYCSKICCSYSAKHAIMLKKANPESKAYVFYIDIRALGKGYEEFIRSAMEEYNVRYIRGRVAKVLESEGKLLVRAEDSLMGNPVEVEADLVVLASAMEPPVGSRELANILGIATDEYGFFQDVESNVRPCHSSKPGIFLAGSCTQPMEIASAVAMGGLSASEALAVTR
ncbi:CoB--CoM heterodisulfide reductase iron-sulfur subunit A family protein [Desulfosporosinus metallidurans]|uniref:CoB--CoM heterodisulfide reductase subunit A n=1 Tax=Desulfosporosinus metallidurans TaxID=1888891 RepID=A0A1Q8QZK8_9FIRM|nr:FAD-dependent oxidoreductase [Desulfosporosinus metallidurans]OLN32809.1 CoB--CoM heterodisulfide reductase subunit A [Desulfosporosinus metallidurans]